MKNSCKIMYMHHSIYLYFYAINRFYRKRVSSIFRQIPFLLQFYLKCLLFVYECKSKAAFTLRMGK